MKTYCLEYWASVPPWNRPILEHCGQRSITGSYWTPSYVSWGTLIPTYLHTKCWNNGCCTAFGGSLAPIIEGCRKVFYGFRYFENTPQYRTGCLVYMFYLWMPNGWPLKHIAPPKLAICWQHLAQAYTHNTAVMCFIEKGIEKITTQSRSSETMESFLLHYHSQFQHSCCGLRLIQVLLTRSKYCSRIMIMVIKNWSFLE